MVPFTSDTPATVQQNLDFPIATASEIKARRRLQPQYRETHVILPTKLGRTNGTDEAHGIARQTEHLHTSERAEVSAAVETESGQTTQYGREVQDGEGGTRLVESPEENTVVRLPPLYTSVYVTD